MINQKQVTQAEITEALMGGATVVTVNKRLANATLQKFEQANIEKGLEAWSTPCVFPWDVWLQNTWEDAVVSGVASGAESGNLSEPALLLTPQQELQVWKGIITEKTDNPLLQINGTARQAQHAWHLMQAWQLDLDTHQFNHNSDSAEYIKWATTFEKNCQDENWLPVARLMDVLRTGVLQSDLAIGGLASTKELILFGFDELTPQQQLFLSALVDTGCNVSWLYLEGLSGKSVKVGCSDSRSEADMAARWVRQCMRDHPDARIGLVVPELQSKRNIVIQSLDRVLLPQALNPTEQHIERPYNVSLGLPLSSYPIIEIALKLSSLLLPTISLQNAGVILRSPFIRGWQQEASARALLDACLRKDVGELDISLKTIRYHANKIDKNSKDTNTKNSACPQLVKNIDAWTEVVKSNSYKQSAAQWAEKIAVLLKAFGWSDGRALSSEEYQQTEAWRDLLISFSTLETVTNDMTASTVVSHLCSMAQDRTYQPQTSDVPIQVLGVLESAEMQFDFLWIMGLHDGIWPPVPRANPFIPIAMQRDAGLPHSSENRELQVARRTTQRLLSSASSDVVVSYPKRDGDNKLRVSSIIDDLAEAYFVEIGDDEPGQSKIDHNKTDQDIIDKNRINLSAATTWIEKTYDSSKLELITDDSAPAISNVATRGGSSILKHQANCPFRAFAELRLGARVLENAGIGLNAMEKGKLIHTILEKTWEKLETQEALLAMEPSNLNKLVRDITNEAVENIAWRFPQTFTSRYKTIESERLCLRVMQWLEFEKQRTPFKVIAPEEKIQVEIVDGVQIAVVIDRIDEQEDARRLVIDYKTGNVKTGQWFGERPEDPQLPLYSMLAEGDIAAVAFAQVRANEMAFKGVAEEAGLLPGVGSFEKIKYTDKETWPEVLHEWKQTIKGLAEDYRNGVATVDPKNKNNLLTCEQTYCKLKSLCRINELTVQDSATIEGGDI